MTFEPTIGLGAIVDILAVVGGLIGGWFTLKAFVKALGEKLSILQVKFDAEVTRNSDQHEENRTRASALELQMTRDYVSKVEFQRFDDNQQKRFERVEHAVNNGALKTAQIVKDGIKDAIREALPLRGRE